jgi:hypothetical protein
MLFSVQSKDIVILDYDLTLGLTRKVVHEYFRNALVTFATCCISPTEVMLSFVHCPDEVLPLTESRREGSSDAPRCLSPSTASYTSGAHGL